MKDIKYRLRGRVLVYQWTEFKFVLLGIGRELELTVLLLGVVVGYCRRLKRVLKAEFSMRTCVSQYLSNPVNRTSNTQIVVVFRKIPNSRRINNQQNSRFL